MADSALTYRRRFNLRIPFVPFSLDSAGGTRFKTTQFRTPQNSIRHTKCAKFFPSHKIMSLLKTRTNILTLLRCEKVGRDGSVGIATRYGLDGLGIDAGAGDRAA
jgi:hypothetical protein